MTIRKKHADLAAESGFENVLLEMLFDRMPMGIAIFDREFNILRYNPTWAGFAERYAPPDAASLRPGMYYFDRFPGAETTTIPMFGKVLSGETIRGEGLKFITGEVYSYWDVVLTPLVEDGQVTGILNVTNDATERITLQQNLEKRVLDRTRELDQKREIAESLRDIIGMINDNIPLETFLDQAVKLAAERLNAAACVLHQFDTEKGLLYTLAHFGMGDIAQKGTTGIFDNLKPRGAANYIRATLNKQPTYTNYPPLPERVDEILHDPTVPDEIKARRVKLRERFAGSFSVPLITYNQVYGGMVFYYPETQEFTEDQIELGLTFAEQVGIAIENARLHERDQERQRELQILLDVAATANSYLDQENLLNRTLDLLISLVGASRAGVSLLDENTGYLLPYTLRPDQVVDPEDMAKMLDAGQSVIKSGELLYIEPDPSKNLLEPGALIPLQIRGKKLGMLGLIGKEGTIFKPEQLALFKSIADQLSVAIENARLFAQAEETAVTAERNRLARDLHDAVTQTLFSSSLIADVLPKIWEKDPDEGKKRLEELRQLTRGALSEMRTLLVELRPAALVDADLSDLIGHLVNAFSARTRLSVEFDRTCSMNPPPEIKEMFYRITQEAFNNIAKHANAQKVTITLDCQPGNFKISIKDDGSGFDPVENYQEGLGIGIMRERAKTLAARLNITSQIGQGTEITLSWKSIKENQ
jgi:signal transduction histidine kinase/PAS domain-containing protein